MSITPKFLCVERHLDGTWSIRAFITEAAVLDHITARNGGPCASRLTVYPIEHIELGEPLHVGLVKGGSR